MRIKIKTAEEQTYEYNENFWSGTKSLAVNGVPAQKINRRDFKLDDKVYTTKGSFLTGVKLVAADGKEIVLCKNKWWEWMFIMLPFAYLCLGLLGGAIGGALSALGALFAATTNASIVRSEMNILLKVILCAVVFAVAFLIWFGIYYAIAGAILGL